MNWRTLIVSSIAAPLLAAALFGAAIRGPAESRPCVQWAGHDSKYPDSGFLLIRDDDAWRTLWAAHAGIDTTDGQTMTRHAAPKIDFDQCLAVAYFRGPTTNHDGEVAESVLTDDGAVRIRFVSSTFQTASFNGPDRGQATSPFGIWVIARTTKPIVIEEGRRGLKNEPIKWKEVKRFESR